MISAATEREIDRWPLGKPFALAPRMQAITLDVIMAGIFGIEGKPQRGTPEHGLRQMIRRLVAASTRPAAQIGELLHIGRDEAIGPMKVGLRHARPAGLRGDRGAAPASATSTSAATSSRCCCRRGPRRARR